MNGGKTILGRVVVLVLVLVFGAVADAAGNEPTVIAQPVAYRVEQVSVGGATEYRFFYESQHFVTLIDQEGTYALRPHPGCDINGWGSTWYGQPFLPGAVLKYTTIAVASVDASGIQVSAAGLVSRGQRILMGLRNR
jgi:hypothetical protein